MRSFGKAHRHVVGDSESRKNSLSASRPREDKQVQRLFPVATEEVLLVFSLKTSNFRENILSSVNQ